MSRIFISRIFSVPQNDKFILFIVNFLGGDAEMKRLGAGTRSVLSSLIEPSRMNDGLERIFELSFADVHTH